MAKASHSHGLWEVTAPPPPPTGTFEGQGRAEVVIVGGGFTGVSAALHLAEAGTDVVLLEAAHIGFGGSGRNVGLVNAGLWLPPDDVEGILGKEAGARLDEVLGRAPALVFELIEGHGIACEAVRNGTLHLAHAAAGWRDLESRHRQLRQRGAPVSLVDRAAAVDRIGSRAFHGALFDARAGTVQPLAYVRGLAAAAQKSGARLYTDSPVTAVERHDRGWMVRLANGSLIADTVILATESYGGRTLPGLLNTLTPLHYFQFATPPLPELVRRSILPGLEGTWDTATVMSSFRLDQAGRLVVGSIGRLDHLAWRIHHAWAQRKLRRVFPQIGPTRLQMGWFGRIGMTSDHVPRFHELGPGLVSVIGYNGRGIGPGTMFGRLLAGYVASRDPAAMPLPRCAPKDAAWRSVMGLTYEAGACGYHVAFA